MNTINKTSNTILKRLRQLAFYMLSTVIFSTVHITTVANANTLKNESELLSSRSHPVNYEDKVPKDAFSRNAHGTNEAQQAAMLALNEFDIASKARKTREQVIAERKNTLHSTKYMATGSLSPQSLHTSNYVDFDIYDASSRLFEDFDYDGFYQTFSVSFDADVYGQYLGERALVFANLYLSRDNGPWELYFTTDTFTIIDDISDDEYEVLTTLDSGYISAHYDVLIELYAVGYSDAVATISSDDDDSLYALPLESANRDEYLVIESYPPEVIVSGGGVSISGLLLLLCVIRLRFINRYNKHLKWKH